MSRRWTVRRHGDERIPKSRDMELTSLRREERFIMKAFKEEITNNARTRDD